MIRREVLTSDISLSLPPRLSSSTLCPNVSALRISLPRFSFPISHSQISGSLHRQRRYSPVSFPGEPELFSEIMVR
ncbi:hypothetical protein H6P81_018125 [Aristolochia fimbriata]|uniref:Uncharacterized protein n=1 Tax=Aristolochia fimbriata TaxID=158543 RepID=A0AAV7E320_ARIFI|nr:hypothetical protein H6P81_018125 [Aristolochia fimbriata]